MPLHEYVCRKCSRRFEELVFGASRPVCPGCRSEDVERLMSVVAIGRGARQPTPGPCESCCGRGGPGCGRGDD